MTDPMTPQRFREIASLFIDVKLHTVAEAVACADAATELRAHADQLERNGERQKAVLNVIEAARCIRHWHNTGRNDEGTIVSTAKVIELWGALEKYDALPKPPEAKQ